VLGRVTVYGYCTDCRDRQDRDTTSHRSLHGHHVLSNPGQDLVQKMKESHPLGVVVSNSLINDLRSTSSGVFVRLHNTSSACRPTL